MMEPAADAGHPSDGAPHLAENRRLAAAGRAARRAGQLAEAIRDLQLALALRPDDADVVAELAEAYEAGGQRGTALRCWECARELRPDDATVAAKCAILGTALEQLRIWLARCPTPPGVGAAEDAFHRGLGLARGGDLAGALAAFLAALEARGDFAEARLALGNVLRSTGPVERARACYEAALDADPTLAAAWMQLGDLLLAAERPADAIAPLRRALALDPTMECAHEALATCLYLTGCVTESASHIARVVTLRHERAAGRGLGALGLRLLGRDWTSAVGHTALLDVFVKLRLLGLLPADRAVVCVHEGAVANRAYLDYWRPWLPLLDDPAALAAVADLERDLAQPVSGLRLADGRTVHIYEAWDVVQRQWDAEGRGPLLTLAPEHARRGERALGLLGLPEGAWFVALHVRDCRANDTRAGRNAAIATYLPAMRAVVARGGWVVRMGDPSMAPLPSMEGVVDYAHSDGRRDWMDVFLWARCRFFVGTMSGPAHVPPTFGVPCALTNWGSLRYGLTDARSRFVPKLLWHERERRPLTFAEMLAPEYGVIEDTRALAARGVEVVDSTPEDIEALVVEMLDGPTRDAEDERLWGRFTSLAAPHGWHGSRLGRAFLRRHADLLG